MRHFLLLPSRGLALAGVLGGLACSTGPQTDTDQPVIHIVTPTANSTVSGTVNFSADAQDAFGIRAVRLYVDGTLLLEDVTSPYEATWNTVAIPDGVHNLAAQAEDFSGNTRSDQLTVTVDNTKQ
ncbi:MAG: Ig-like domain-containing protein [Gemmatimonadota bacterium]